MASDIHAFLVTAPIWASPVLAVVAALAVRFGGEKLLHFPPSTAWSLGLYAAGLILLLGVVAMVEKWRRRRQLLHTRTLADLRALTWRDFEKLVSDAYRRHGWRVEEVATMAGGGADGGVDLLLRRPGETVAVQCKHWQSRSVGVVRARELQGTLGDFGAQRGILVTCGDFTPDATAFANRNALELVDGARLLALLPVDHVAPQRVATSPIGTEIRCPRCQSPMVLRKSKNGEFLGCSRFPRCRGTRPDPRL